jgi:hypothetical protein
MLTKAACTACGRGYLHVNHEGTACLACDGRIFNIEPVETPRRAVDEPRGEWAQQARDRQMSLLDPAEDTLR